MKQQQGSALIISLLILLVMTLIGISAMSTATMEEKMAANDRNQKVAFLTAEAGLTEAENAIATNNTYQDLQNKLADKKSGVYEMGTLDNSSFFDPAKWQASTHCTTTKIIGNNGSQAACYKAEIMDRANPIEICGYGGECSPQPQMVRITTRGTDSTGIATALVQTHLEYELVQ
jgi:type IV pilus assembly protein PilX